MGLAAADEGEFTPEVDFDWRSAEKRSEKRERERKREREKKGEKKREREFGRT